MAPEERERDNVRESTVIDLFLDPMDFVGLFWPEITLYDKQQEILYSVRDNRETIVPAAHELGKDFICALAILWFFCSRRPARVLTTSPNSTQLEDVLWGEIRTFVESSKYPLPIELMGDMKMYQKYDDGTRVPGAEVVGRVYQNPASMMGRHCPRAYNIPGLQLPTTLLAVDEASGCDDEGYKRADSWAHRKLVIGNPYSTTNFFFQGTQEGDVPSTNPGLGQEVQSRKVIHIAGQDSPNVQLALNEIEKGKEPSHKELIPGVLSYAEFKHREEHWDEIRKLVGLYGRFYIGAKTLMFPPIWLDESERYDKTLKNVGRKRIAKGIGVDPAEGGDSTTFSIVDEKGLIELVDEKTPDTSEIGRKTLAIMRDYKLYDCGRVCFDRGGGGKQHVDQLRRTMKESPHLRDEGFFGMFRSVGFGERPSGELRTAKKGIKERTSEQEQKSIYKNKRAEMYGLLRDLMNPKNNNGEVKFAIPAEYGVDTDKRKSLRYQLSVIPLTYEPEGKLYLIPKSSPRKEDETLIKLVGHSPDEADSLVLAVYAMLVRPNTVQVGGILT